MKIAYSPYVLQGAKMQRKGALLQVYFSEGCVGYADCHPWPELGDLPLQQQLESLLSGDYTRLTKRALDFATVDAAARQDGGSLLAGKKIPDSHYLVMDMEQLQVEKLLLDGFQSFKFKVGSNPSQELSYLKNLLSQVPEARLDFNFRLDYPGYINFMLELKAFWPKIAFCEDPFPFDPLLWKQAEEITGVPLALDRATDSSQTASYRIIKPAIEEPRPFEKLVITSYLGHPFEQACAAFVASQYTTSLCGLQSHYVYEKNSFSEQLSQKGPSFTNPSGTGFGFDEQLQNCMWTPL